MQPWQTLNKYIVAVRIFQTHFFAIGFAENYNVMASESKHAIHPLWKILVLALIIGLRDYGKKNRHLLYRQHVYHVI